MWLHVDQRPMRARCEAILARVATAPEHPVPSEATERELLDVLGAVRLVDGARRGTTAMLFTEVDDPADRHRTIERAIPARGALRRGRAVATVLVVGAVLVGLARLSPWLLLVPAVLLGVWFWRWYRRWFASAASAIYVSQTKEQAAIAEAAGDTRALAAIYEEVRQMIAQDRIPARNGFHLADVLAAAATLTPLPVELPRELWRLLVIAPEADLSFDLARETIERKFQDRPHQLASRIRRALRDGTDLGPLLDECSTLIERLPPRLLVALPVVLDEVVAVATEPATIERADALHERLSERRREVAETGHEDATRSTRHRRPPPEPAASSTTVAPTSTRRGARPIAALHAAVASANDGRAKVLALYRSVRDAAEGNARERRQQDLITAMQLAATWASKHGDEPLLGEIRQDARALLARRWIPAGTGAQLAGVLRECVDAEPLPTTLLDDYAALGALAPDVEAPLFWSIVDAAIARLELRVRALVQTAGAGSRAALAEMVVALEATAGSAGDPEIATRARALAAQVDALRR